MRSFPGWYPTIALLNVQQRVVLPLVLFLKTCRMAKCTGTGLVDSTTLKANDELKNICQIEHTGRRSFTNFITNLIAGLLAYSFLPKKPTIKVDSAGIVLIL
jgi:hypothetical protein